MKKIVIFSILLLAVKVYTQTVPAKEVSLDPMLANIDKTSVTSGIIYDRVASFANLYHFNAKTGRNVADFKFFKQALLEMYLASNQSQFCSIETLKINLKPILYTDASVNMGILNTPFQSINYNEENPSLGRLQYDATNNLFYASTNTTYPIFNSSFVTVISPLKEVVKGDYISFNWASNFIFENTFNHTKKIKNLTVNYGTGKVYTVISNFVITAATQQISYPDTGEKQLTFTITYSDNSTLITHAKIKYLKVVNTSSFRIMGSDPNCGSEYGLTENRTSTSEYAFQGYDEPFAFKGFIECKVFYRTIATEKKILNPIIIVDGFDPGDKRQVLPCDYEPFEYKLGESRAISEVMKYGPRNGNDLIKELQAKGYDVVIVNQPTYYVMITPPYQVVPRGTAGSIEIDGGGDYIERNGLNLVTLIKKINTEVAANGSTEKLVIVGPSMGGQISRYALAYMEKNNIPHNTRLWVSVDSPHLGANIPVGAQAEINLLKSSSTEAEDFYTNQLGSVAAKQQLIEFHKESGSYHTVDQTLLDARTISQGFSTNTGSMFFQNFYNNQFSNGLPNSKGYPLNLRKIALINGSLTGNKIGFDSQQTLNIRGFADVCFLYCTKIHVASMEVYTMPRFGNTATIARFKNKSKDIPTNAPNINSRGNMDITPGGYFNSYGILHNSIMGKSGPRTTFAFPFHIDLKPEDINLESRTNTKIHSFIPTFSALGMKNPDQDWGQRLDRNLVCSGETPFDSYYGEVKNSEHTSFNDNSVAWLFKELGDSNNSPKPQAPSFPMKEDVLAGASIVCFNSNETFQFQFLKECDLTDIPIWSASSNLQIVSSTATSVTVKGISFGYGSITATFQNGKIISTGMKVGSIDTTDSSTFHFNKFPAALPGDFTDVYGNVQQSGNTIFNVTINSVFSNDENSAYVFSNFQIDNVVVNASAQKMTTNRFTIFVPQAIVDGLECPVLDFDLKATSSCGDIKELRGSIPIKCLHFLSPDYFMNSNAIVETSFFKIFPNPSNTIFNISLFDSAMVPSPKAKITAILYDLNGRKKRSVAVVNNTAAINVSHLTKGIYVLKIIIDGATESHPVIVQ